MPNGDTWECSYGDELRQVAQPVEEAVAEAQVDGAPRVPRLIGRTRRLSSPSGRALARTLSLALTLSLTLTRRLRRSRLSREEPTH